MDEVGACMTQCIVYDETTKESETFCSLTAAKKWMRERIKQKHEVSGQKYRVYSDGEFVKLRLYQSHRQQQVFCRQYKADEERILITR